MNIVRQNVTVLSILYGQMLNQVMSSASHSKTLNTEFWHFLLYILAFRDNFVAFPADEINTFGVPYDVFSVMHYSTEAFSTDGKPTITLKDQSNPETISYVGQRQGMTEKDVLKVKRMYQCPWISIRIGNIRLMIIFCVCFARLTTITEDEIIIHNLYWHVHKSFFWTTTTIILHTYIYIYI